MLGARHLRHLLANYATDYNEVRERARFAFDSSLEEAGFELPVPRKEGDGFETPERARLADQLNELEIDSSAMLSLKLEPRAPTLVPREFTCHAGPHGQS